ncbi:MAG: NAD(+)/NADH kinase [Deltaproteobacteria bacterium]|nr:NAD(+)/NADH kinase [Deltaproteobacteria bacterium]
MVDTIAVVLKPNASEAESLLAVAFEAAKGARFVIEDKALAARHGAPNGLEPLSRDRLEREATLVLGIGGDGTLIQAASLFKDRLVPILGVNLGRLGFLTNVSREELTAVLRRALAGSLPYVDRMRLDVEVRRKTTLLLEGRVLNDAVVSPKSLARLAQYRVTLGGDLLTTLRADGVIVATPTGSTAYSMAAGGAILAPGLLGIAITPICPQALSQRPIVVAPDADIAVSLESDSEVFCSLDGRAGQELQQGDVMTVRRAAVGTRIMEVPWRTYYQALRTKLRWGEG